MKDPRPKEYLYWNQLMDHLGHDTKKFFNGELIYPRQFEIHLPGNHKQPCDLNCPHCAGRYFNKELGTWELEGLELLNKLQGAIPFHIYGGAFTEPTLNPYMIPYLAMTKKHNNHFGIHTNGTVLNRLEERQGWLTEVNRIATDSVDYLSISIDAGFPWSWAKTKGSKHPELYNEIIIGLEKAVKIREEAGKGHAIRLCYLISKQSGTKENFDSIIAIARDLKIDSLRFSIPFAPYNQVFDKVREYKSDIEIPCNEIYYNWLTPSLSQDKSEKPYIFYTGPEFTDIDRFTFNKCVYGYYQITYGADGYCYKCSTTGTPTAKENRIGKITSNLEEFNKMVMLNQDQHWKCQEKCFARGLRCNRMGMECNTEYAQIASMD